MAETNITQIKVNTKEMRDILVKYPKIALKGIPIYLDAGWKKNFVAFRCILGINVGIKMRIVSLGNSISEEFESKFATGAEMQETPENMAQLSIVLNIKKRLQESIKLEKYIEQLNPEIVANASLIEEGVYSDYVTSKAIIIQEFKESQTIIKDIDNSINTSYKNLNAVNVLQEEVDKTATTEQDVLRLLKKVQNSLGIKLVD